MTADLQQTRYDQIVRRVGGIIGPGSKVAEALSELFPVIDIERVPGELLALGGTQLCAGAATLLAGGGVAARIQVFNPVGSGKLLTVSSLVATTNATQLFRYATTNTALTTGVGTEVFRDRRFAAISRPSGQIRSQASVALTDANGFFRLLSNTSFILTDENSLAVLPPGTGFEVGAGSNTTTVTMSFLWRERVALESELLLT